MKNSKDIFENDYSSNHVIWRLYCKIFWILSCHRY